MPLTLKQVSTQNRRDLQRAFEDGRLGAEEREGQGVANGHESGRGDGD